MGRLSGQRKNSSIKRAFTRMVLATTLIVAAASGLTIGICAAVQRWLVPISDEVMLHAYDGDKLQFSSRIRANNERFEVAYLFAATDDEAPHAVDLTVTHYAVEPLASLSTLTPKKRLLYDCLSLCMILMPMLYALAGILVCSRLFYQKRLAYPFAILTQGAQKIADNDLDFTIAYPEKDELGQLCASFETMRRELLESQREIWAVMEERRQLNASAAHDLRTPITIIEGYTEYLQRNLKSGRVDEAKLTQVLDHLSASACRLERYVDSVRDIQRLDDLRPEKAECLSSCLFSEIQENFAVLAQRAGKQFVMRANTEERMLYLDKQLFFRILENVVSNALRYAQSQVSLELSVTEGGLTASVIDDGAGFSEEALRLACTPFYKEAGSEHLGIGLSISRILCKKHGGTLTLANQESGGGIVTLKLEIKKPSV